MNHDISDDEIGLISDIITSIDDRLDRALADGRQALRPRAHIYARVLFAVISSARETSGAFGAGLLAIPLLEPLNNAPAREEVTALDHLIDATIAEHTAPAN